MFHFLLIIGSSWYFDISHPGQMNMEIPRLIGKTPSDWDASEACHVWRGIRIRSFSTWTAPGETWDGRWQELKVPRFPLPSGDQTWLARKSSSHNHRSFSLWFKWPFIVEFLLPCLITGGKKAVIVVHPYKGQHVLLKMIGWRKVNLPWFNFPDWERSWFFNP